MVTHVGAYHRRERCQPVDPAELFALLAQCLGLHDAADGHWSADRIVRQDFPSLTLGASQFRDRYLLKEVLRKFPGWNLGIDKKAAAFESLRESEVKNVVTSKRLADRDVEGYDPRVRQVYDLSCRKAISVLGKFRWPSFLNGCRFGPGATTGHRGNTAILSKKLLSGPFDVTRRALPLLELYLSTAAPGWGKYVLVEDLGKVHSRRLEAHLCGTRYESEENGSPSFVTIRDTDRFSTAPKNAETDRTILIQPDGNVFLQLGVGYCMRLALLREGVNLNSQERNQSLALRGSLDGSVSTVDVRNASNSVVEQVVWDHLGNHSQDHTDPTWYRIVDCLRTESYRYGCNTRRHCLFSAMGNGFTFELESLIFYSLAHSTCVFLGVSTEDVSVFGDDIIVPTEVIPLLRDVLSYAGFEFNEGKSFYSSTGPHFRESCGKHYLGGVDVTPIYVSDEFSPSEIILLHNNLLRWAADSSATSFDPRIVPVLEWLLGHLSPRCRKTAIPFGVENDGLIRSFDLTVPSVVRADTVKGSLWTDVRGFRASTVKLVSRPRKLDGETGLLSWLYRRAFKRVSLPAPDLPRRYATCKGYRLLDESLRKYGLQTVVSDVPDGEAPKNKVSLRFGTRCVRDWSSIHPWAPINPLLISWCQIPALTSQGSSDDLKPR